MSNGWTKTPNDVYEAMASMTEPELRIALALVRETYGRQKSACKLTYKELQAMTGLGSFTSIKEGLDGVTARGFFRPGSGRSVWEITTPPVVITPSVANDPTPSVAEDYTECSDEITPSVVSTSDNPISSNNKIDKEKEKRKKKEPTGEQLTLAGMVNSLATATGMSASLNWKELSELATALLADSYQSEQITLWYSPGGWWSKNDWRGNKGQRPTVKIIRETVMAARDATAVKTTRTDRQYNLLGDNGEVVGQLHNGTKELYKERIINGN